MTTKQYLHQIDRFDKTIQNKLSEIYQLKSMACGITVSNEGDRVQTSSDKDQLGTVVARIVDLENEVNHMVDKRAYIVDQIENMENTNMYDVLAKRYILRKDLKVMAVDRGVTFRHIKRLLYEALEAFEKKYGKEYL